MNSVVAMSPVRVLYRALTCPRFAVHFRHEQGHRIFQAWYLYPSRIFIFSKVVASGHVPRINCITLQFAVYPALCARSLAIGRDVPNSLWLHRALGFPV